MGPRKRPKPNPKAVAESYESSQSQEEQPISERETISGAEKTHFVEAEKNKDGSSTPQSIRSWYGGTRALGNKATPVTQVVKESISAAAGIAPEAVVTACTRTPPPPCTPLRTSPGYQRLASSSRSLPLTATTTKLNIASDAITSLNEVAKERRSRQLEATGFDGPQTGPAGTEGSKATVSTNDVAPGSSAKGVKSASVPDRQSDIGPKLSRDYTGWLAWFSWSEQAEPLESGNIKKDGQGDQICESVKGRPQSTTAEINGSESIRSTQRRNSEPATASPVNATQEKSQSWLKVWANLATQSKAGPISTTAGNTENAIGELESPSHGRQDPSQDDAKSIPEPSSEAPERPKSNGWAFWSRDIGSKNAGGDPGKLALAGSSSQSKPENATVDDTKGVPNKVEKMQKPQSLEVANDAGKAKTATNASRSEVKSQSLAVVTNDAPTEDVATKKEKELQNLLLPSFTGTYRSSNRPGLLQQLSRWFSSSPFAHDKHVEIVSSPPRIKRALAIGVHGYFPAPIVRSLLGQPTGTSIRFANSAASAIQRWMQVQGYSCEIEKVALEGEGKIAERIDLLWTLMLNWIDKIRKADFVMVACHSQGCPVALMLVAKLISFGCLSSSRVGVCAMAGINLGPFVDYKSRWISGTAGELFDFARPDSKVSKEYEAALDIALRFGVKIVYVGSIDDQLVSLEVNHCFPAKREYRVLIVTQSSTFGPIVHPHVYRAVFIDGRVHAPDFLTHLVGFALKLRNLGISDHGLIRELSSPLAGSLYSGEGHSRIYEDESVYYLAVQHALETTTLASVPMQTHRDDAGSCQNPYILPFAMRGLLEEDYVRTELYGEITDLIRQFDDWRPSSKVLKDVKFRLEGVRSKL
ncbi:MAG: hypothetical protein Q9217_000350 [Psora testacea]